MSSPTRQLSQAAQERKPVFQPARLSNSRMIEQARGGGIEVSRQLGNLVAKTIE